jgi:hypothetical protein
MANAFHAAGMRLVQILLGLNSCLETAGIEEQIAQLKVQLEAAANRGNLLYLRRA